MTMSPALRPRIVALEMLQNILREHQAMDQCLSSDRKFAALDSEDRGFVRMLVTTTLRRLGEIDHLWQSCLDKKLPRKSDAAADILRLGTAQLVFLKTPPHAAIHTSVEMAGYKNMTGFKGLINAVLRRLQTESDVKTASIDKVALNTPSWLMQSWINAYGEDVAYAIAAAHAAEPPLDISVKSNPEQWAERLGATILPNGTLRSKTGGRIESKDGFEDGEWWVQDAAASLPAKLLGDVRGKTVIDLCAAPGGKTAQLAAFGAHVIAVDQSSARLKRLSENLQRLHLTADIVCADALDWQPAQKASHILLDAPCSATGTIRRHPDIPYLKTPEDINRLAELQFSILNNAADMLLDGGVLVYAVCSLQPQESVDVIDKILKHRKHLHRSPILPSELPNLAELITPKGDLRTLPCDLGDLGGMDGFYACRLQRGA